LEAKMVVKNLKVKNNKKKKITAILIILCILSSTLILYKLYPNTDYVNNKRIQYITSYLNNRYECTFTCIDDTPIVIDGDIEYQFKTNDNNEIVFTVKYWIGALYTPWGDFPLIRVTHIVENFDEEIANYVIENSEFQNYQYDITNQSIDETIQKLYNILEEIDVVLVDYGIIYGEPDITLQLIDNDEKMEITYRNSSPKFMIKEALREFLLVLN
jgi:hypothetical protein